MNDFEKSPLESTKGSSTSWEDEELRRIKGGIFSVSRQLEDDIRTSDGPLTKKGKLLNYREIHAAELGAGLTLLGYIITPAFLAAHVIILFKSLFDKHVPGREPQGTVKEVGEELHYYISASAVTAGTLERLGYPTPDVAIKSLEYLKLFLGA